MSGTSVDYEALVVALAEEFNVSGETRAAHREHAIDLVREHFAPLEHALAHVRDAAESLVVDVCQTSSPMTGQTTTLVEANVLDPRIDAELAKPGVRLAVSADNSVHLVTLRKVLGLYSSEEYR